MCPSAVLNTNRFGRSVGSGPPIRKLFLANIMQCYIFAQKHTPGQFARRCESLLTSATAVGRRDVDAEIRTDYIN